LAGGKYFINKVDCSISDAGSIKPSYVALCIFFVVIPYHQWMMNGSESQSCVEKSFYFPGQGEMGFPMKAKRRDDLNATTAAP